VREELCRTRRAPVRVGIDVASNRHEVSINFEDSEAPRRKAVALSAQDDVVAQAELEVADTIGHLMHFWGFKRRMGRIWTLLYLSPEPLCAAELGRRLKMSAGSVSMTLADLLKWGAVRRSWRPGERRDYFEPETSIWKLLSRVLRERELSLVREVRSTMETAEAVLARAAVSGRAAKQLDFKRSRISTLRKLAKVGEGLLTSLDAGRSVNPSKLREVQSDARR
jgi:DNA-binding transcriptional regulator GbsR (MarR family)